VHAQPKLVYVVSEDWYFVSHRIALAVAAKEAGYDVTVITQVNRHGDKIRDAGLALEPIAFDRSTINPFSDAKTLGHLVALYRRLTPDIVHHVAMKPVLYGSLAARRARVPGVVNALMGLGYVFTSGDVKARALKPLVRTALKAALSHRNSRVIVQNADDEQLLRTEHLAEPSAIRLIRGSGVDLTAFPFSEPPAGRPRVVLPARMLRDKGVVEFVTAARILKAEGVDADFVLAGSPDPVNPSSLTDAEITSWVREGLVTYLGWREDMPALLASATVVCLPSYREGLPKVLLEAAACGRAIVTTDVPGCREIVQDGVNGWLAPPRDATALADALRAALTRDDLRASFAHAGRQLIEREHAIGAVIGATLAVYAEVLGSVTGAQGRSSHKRAGVDRL
jgi:glycosyltransferase involved in cell wall biosynthesis